MLESLKYFVVEKRAFSSTSTQILKLVFYSRALFLRYVVGQN